MRVGPCDPPRVPDRVALEHQHVAPAAQRPCGREPEQPAADDDDVGPRHCHAATITRDRDVEHEPGRDHERVEHLVETEAAGDGSGRRVA